jgi:hypothetical protein
MIKNGHLFVPSQPKIRERTPDQPSSQVGTESADSVTNILRNTATLPCNSQTAIGQTGSCEPASAANPLERQLS